MLQIICLQQEFVTFNINSRYIIKIRKVMPFCILIIHIYNFSTDVRKHLPTLTVLNINRWYSNNIFENSISISFFIKASHILAEYYKCL